MKRLLIFALTLVLLALPLSGLADGMVLRTTSNLAGMDPAAQVYVDILEAWQEANDCTVEDYSALADEAWIAEVVQDVNAGKLDVIYFFADTADSAPILDQLVPIAEILQAYPGAQLRDQPLLREPDGQVYAIPVRGFWEGMYCNKDLFDAHGLALPTNAQQFETAIARFHEAGVTPLAVALGEVPNYLVEHVILACGTPDEHRARPRSAEQLPTAWTDGMRLIRHLAEIHAFSPEAAYTDEFTAQQMFRDKQAAMLIEGSWFADTIDPASWDSTVVLPFPAYAPHADATAAIGTMSMGFSITRAAWNDPERREAAVSLLAALTSPSATAQFGYSFDGALLQSAQQMMGNAQALCSPIGDAMDPDVRAQWFTRVPGLADGTQDATALMPELIQAGAFAW